MKWIAIFLCLVSCSALGETFTLVCEVRPVANERIIMSRSYRIDTLKQTVEGYNAKFSDTAIVVEKPFLENGPHRDKLARYTFNRASGRLTIVSQIFGVAPFQGVCQKDPQPKF